VFFPTRGKETADYFVLNRNVEFVEFVEGSFLEVKEVKGSSCAPVGAQAAKPESRSL
jgi:hypothetical protein